MKSTPEILFEDDDIIVVNKPPNLLTIPDRFNADLPNMLDLLRSKSGDVFTVHRLDRTTSGLLVFAKNEAAHRHLSLQFEGRTVEKVYLALVEGVLLPETGNIDKAIAPHPRIPDRMVVQKSGKSSLTEYRAVEFFKNFTLAEARIHTGRMHQIRVHFESIGFPLAVDEVYGRRAEIFFTDIKKNKVSLGKFAEPRPLMSRTSLHSFRLKFQHPKTGEWLSFEADLPKDFRALLNQLRQWGK